MFKSKFTAIVSLIGSYALTTTPALAAWTWQHPGIHGGNGMLNTTILTRKNVDWAYGNWKGECSGKASNGIDPVGTELFEGFATNFDTGGLLGDYTSWTNAILCTNADKMNGWGWTIDKFSYVVLNVYNQNDQRGSWQQRGDWYPNYYKGLCPDGYAVNGLAQTPVNNADTTSVLCSKISLAHPSACWVSTADEFGYSVGEYYGDYGLSGQDWNYGNYKTSCWADTYVAGIAFSTFDHDPRALLCCQ
jgi:hypothetical protein